MYFKTKINFPKTHFGSLVKHITSFWLLFTAAFGVKHPGAMHLFKKQKQKKTWVINATYLYTCIHNFIFHNFWQIVVSANFFRAGCP